ncbi:MAG: orotidine-5'-phosphate decarboxylase, partial [Phototrophicales bacterium]
YVHSIFDELGFDAITLNPYLGYTALLPFLERKEKGCIILCRTSNVGADEFQNLIVEDRPLWQYVAERVSKHWNQYHNCMLVVGATQPSVLKQVRHIVGDMPILVPGIGAQGGDLAAVLLNGLDSQKRGIIINASRSIIFSENPAHQAQVLQQQINAYR